MTNHRERSTLPTEDGSFRLRARGNGGVDCTATTLSNTIDAPVQKLDARLELDGVPRRLGDYEVIRALGSGAMGSVYEVRPTRGGQHLAIKLIDGLAPEAALRLKREYRCLSQIHHPNVIRNYGLFQQDTTICLSMELIAGMGLVHWCRKHEQSAPRAAAASPQPYRDFPRFRQVFRQLANGLVAVHAAGVLHRDIKPDNVLITQDGRVVILDFGLVYGDPLGLPLGRSADGKLRGTPQYMSPEQAIGDELTTASDWYAVGAMMYELLTGRAPFHGSGLHQLLALKTSETPPSPSEVASGIPPEISDLTIRLLSRDPRERPDAAEIERILGNEDEGSAQPAPSMPSRKHRRLIGRGDVLDQLAADLERTRLGRPHVTILRGESGIGKTTVLREYLSNLPESHIVLWGKSSPQESIPYMTFDPIVDGLALELRRAPLRSRTREVTPRNCAALLELFPVLRTIEGMEHAPDEPEADQKPASIRRRAFEALREMLGRISDLAVIVIALDDVQWCDRDSARLLAALLTSEDAPCLHLVAAYRPVDGGEGWWDALERELGEAGQNIRELQLSSLSTDDAETLARQLLPDDLGVAGRVARESRGNPFFIEELARSVRSGTKQQPTGQTEEIDSLHVAGLVRSRVDQLGEASRLALQLLALAGGRAPLSVLTGLSGTTDGFQSVLAELQDESLVHSTTSGVNSTIELRHDRIREAVLAYIDPDERPRLHLALARALESSRWDDRVDLGRHYRLAGNLDEAIRHTIAAAENAQRAYAFEHSARLWREALDIGVYSGDKAADLWSRLGQALACAGRYRDAADAYSSAASVAVDPNLCQRAVCLAAEHALCIGGREAGYELLAQAFRQVELPFPRNNVRLLWGLIIERLRLIGQGKVLEGQDWREPTTQQRLRLETCWTATLGLVAGGDPALGYFQSLYHRLALEYRSSLHVARSCALEAYIMAARFAERRRDDTVRLIHRAGEFSVLSNDPTGAAWVAHMQAQTWVFLGDWNRALVDVEEARVVERRVKGAAALPHHANDLCGLMALTETGAFSRLESESQTLLKSSLEFDDGKGEVMARHYVGVANLVRGRIEEARAQLSAMVHRNPNQLEQFRPLVVISLATLLLNVAGRIDGPWREIYELALAQPVVPWNRTPIAGSGRDRALVALQVQAARATSRRAPMLSELARIARRLERYPLPYTRGWASLVRIESQALSSNGAKCVELARNVLGQLEQQEHRLATVRWLLARELGSTAGRPHRELALRYFERERIADPDQFVRIWMPAWAARCA